jgi:hypothetical protein
MMSLDMNADPGSSRAWQWSPTCAYCFFSVELICEGNLNDGINHTCSGVDEDL